MPPHDLAIYEELLQIRYRYDKISTRISTRISARISTRINTNDNGDNRTVPLSPIPDSESNYYGKTFVTGFGTPGFEAHCERTYTGTLPYFKINIFGSAEKIYDAIMGW